MGRDISSLQKAQDTRHKIKENKKEEKRERQRQERTKKEVPGAP